MCIRNSKVTQMNRDQAIAALRQGKTLTHVYFTSDEWIKQVGHMYVFEDGVTCSPCEFWANRLADGFNKGWKVIAAQEEISINGAGGVCVLRRINEHVELPLSDPRSYTNYRQFEKRNKRSIYKLR